MKEIRRDGDGFIVSAGLLSDAFGLAASDIRALMHEGRITSLSEKGEGDDEGRWRLTFYYGERALRLTVNEDGTIRFRGIFPVPGRSARRKRADAASGVAIEDGGKGV